MTSIESVLEAAWVLNPRSVQRARRLALAMQLLGEGQSKRDAIALLRQRCGIGQPEAWRIVDIASDMAGANAEAQQP
jgi:hypothetical protein